jgi:hypothetical protein
MALCFMVVGLVLYRALTRRTPTSWGIHPSACLCRPRGAILTHVRSGSSPKPESESESDAALLIATPQRVVARWPAEHADAEDAAELQRNRECRELCGSECALLSR